MPALRVVHEFQDYSIGALIRDAEKVEAVLASSFAQHVVRVVDDTTDPATSDAPAADDATAKGGKKTAPFASLTPDAPPSA